MNEQTLSDIMILGLNLVIWLVIIALFMAVGVLVFKLIKKHK